MMKQQQRTTRVLGSLLLILVIIVGGALVFNSQKEKQAERDEFGEGTTPSGEPIAYAPPSMDDVPEGEEGALIRRGHELMMETGQLNERAEANGEEPMVNNLACTSCHASGGLDENTSSLVGVSSKYPKYSARDDRDQDLADRVNGCMLRSMNGRAFEEEDPDLLAIVAYLDYISEGIPKGSTLPWLDKNEMKDVPTPNLDDGERIFKTSCITCHAADGSGSGPITGPALWGEDSFNDGAGMGHLSKMAGFVQNNMPQNAPGTLSKQEAADVAAFVLSHDRPHWEGSDQDWPNGDGPTDIMDREKRAQIANGTIDWDKVLGK